MAIACPFCKTQINDGAVICTGCGARKVRRGLPILNVIVLLGMMFGGIGWAFKSHELIGGLGLSLISAGVIILAFKNMNDTFWER